MSCTPPEFDLQRHERLARVLGVVFWLAITGCAGVMLVLLLRT